MDKIAPTVWVDNILYGFLDVSLRKYFILGLQEIFILFHRFKILIH